MSNLTRLFGCFLTLWGFALCPGAADTARAQSCHAPALREHGEARMRVSLTSTYATYDHPHTSGEYQGLHLLAAYMNPWVYAHISVPGYRLARNGRTSFGLGDVGFDARVTAYRSEDGKLSAGVELAASFPSGSQARDLGMGHVMLMPGGWLRLEHEKLLLWLQVHYGRALGSTHDGAHHHGVPGPIVSPMNASELGHGLGIGYLLHDSVRAIARVAGAVPVVVGGGQAREALAAGLQFLFGQVDASFELELPLVGAPFTTRALLTLGAQW